MSVIVMAGALLWAGMVSQGPTSAQSPALTQRGSVAGRVVAADASERPLGGAIVVLTGSVGRLQTVTDRDGRFHFDSVPVGRFTASASKRAYLDSAGGVVADPNLRSVVIVQPGNRTDIVLRMTKGAVIAGRVMRTDGSPLSGVQVAARRLADSKMATSWQRSDDEGHFRIYGLPAGSYVVLADDPVDASAGPVRIRSVQEVDAALARLASRRDRRTSGTEPPVAVSTRAPLIYAPVYLPGTSLASDAAPIALEAGEVRENVDFVFELIPTSTVSGRVVWTAGPASRVHVVLQPSSGPVAGPRYGNSRCRRGVSFCGGTAGQLRRAGERHFSVRTASAGSRWRG